MPRTKRITLGGYVYHVLNRANGRLRIFRKDSDFLAFEQILAEGIERYSMRLCGYCIMSNHWHLLLWPIGDGDLSEFMRWITLTHNQRFHISHATVGMGHLYQGRFKSFPIQHDAHYLTVMRYIEAKPLQAETVKRAGDWPWSSLAVRNGLEAPFELSQGPLKLPSSWDKLVNQIAPPDQLEELKNSINRGAPFGAPDWRTKTAVAMNLESTLRPRGRPKKCTGHEWRLLKRHIASSTVLLLFLIADSVWGRAPTCGVLIGPVLMEPDVRQFHTTLPGRSLAIALTVASPGQTRKLLSHGQHEQS